MKKLLTFLLFFSLLTFGSFGFISEANAGSGGDTEFNSNIGSTTMNDVLCTIMKFITGGVGKTFASFAVIFVGVGFLTGKTTWTAMITFALGIAAIFGAPTVIRAFTGGEAACSKSTTIGS